MYKILLIGDDGLDRYRYGIVDRLSPEAPVPVFKPEKEICIPGMANNVRRNLEQLGCTVDYLHTETSEKTRLIDSRSHQHIVRIDRDARATAVSVESVLIDIYDTVVVSDYEKGTVTYELVEDLRQKFAGPIFVDTKKTDLARFNGCFVKINTPEFHLARTFPDNLIVTDGRQGARYQDQFYPGRAVELADSCGAGDTFLAALAIGYLNNSRNIAKAIEFANLAASITVQHIGVYAPTMEEICGLKA